jgi:hypothetical protein
VSVELFNGLVSPEIAGVLDEAMLAMPDSAVHVTPGQADWDRVHVSIGGARYDLLVAIDGGDKIASFKLVPVGGVGRCGNAVAVLKAGLSMLTAADGIGQTEDEKRNVWILDEGCEARWYESTGRLVIECEHTCGQPGPIRGIDVIRQDSDLDGDDRWYVRVETTGEPYWFRFDARPSAVNFAAWLGERIREGQES